MKILKKLIRPVACASVVGCIVFISVPSAFSQIVERSVWRQDFISRDYRPRWGEEYENFGQYDFRRYPRVKYDYVQMVVDKQSSTQMPVSAAQPARRGPVSPVTYDQFGNFLLPGGEIYTFSWNKSRIGAREITDSNWINSIFNNLVILSDDFSNWQTKFMVAQASLIRNTDIPQNGIRAYFTPSTLKISNFSGIRWDASSRKNNVSFIASTGQVGEPNMPLYGIHWQSVLGDVLKVGASYVHKQRGTIENSQMDIDEIIKDEPRYVYLIVTDDSPEDTGPGARVYNVAAVINGKPTPIAYNGENYPVRGRAYKIPNVITANPYAGSGFTPYYIFQGTGSDGTENGTTQIQSYHTRTEDHRNNYGSWFLDLMDQQNLTNPNKVGTQNYGYNNLLERFFSKTTTGNLGIINVDDAGQRVYAADGSSGYIEATGTDVIIYEFIVPSGTRELAFNVQAANDYCIDIIASMYRYQGVPHPDVDWNSITSSNWNVYYDLKHCVKASGNVKDSSNLQWVKVTYDRLVSTDVYGMNMELDWNGLFIRAEYNVNSVTRAYPVAIQVPKKGKTNTDTARAWFVNVEKDLGKTSIGGEFFNYPMDYMRYWPTVEDNDDDNNRVGVDIYGIRQTNSGSNNTVEHPGIDVDFDLIDDNEWQGELYIDYNYDTLRFGDDFNHNGIVDYREDDTQIDLPYERDSRGQHYFFKYHPTENTLVTFGHYDVRQEYFEGRNFTRYLKIEHYQHLGNLGEMLVYSRTERVKDNYKLSPTYASGEGNRSVVNNHYYINNWQTTNYLQSRLTFIPNTNIINNVRFNTSYEMGDLYRPQGRTYDELILHYMQIYNGDQLIDRYGQYNYAFEHKADYTLRMADARLLPEISFMGYRLWKEKRIRELKITPAMKFVHSYGINQRSNYFLYSHDRHEKHYDFYPVVRMDYRVSPRTLLRFAMQGFPGFEEIHRNSTEKLLDTDERNMILALENRTLYQGFNIVVTMGMALHKVKYINDPGLQLARDDDSTRLFYHPAVRSWEMIPE